MPDTPPSAEVFLDQGILNFNQGRYASSIERFSEALRKTPKNQKILLFRAMAFKMAGDGSAALRDLNGARKLEPGSAAVRLSLAGLLRDLGRHEAALSECRVLLRLDPQSPAGHELKSDLELKLGLKREAQRSLAQAVRLEPGRLDWRLRRAGWLRDLGELKSALREYERAARRDPKLPGIFEAKADLEISLGRQASAWASLKRAIALEPGEPRLRVKAAHLLRAMGRFKDALRQCRRAVRIDPKAAAVYELMADLEPGRNGKASLMKALALTPASAALRFKAANFFQAAGEVRSALRHCEEAVKLAPENQGGRELLAELRLKQAAAFQDAGKITEALEESSRAIAAHPRSAKAYEFKSGLQALLEDKESAWASLRKAMALEPRSARLRVKAAGLLQERRYLGAALAQCRTAIGLDPGMPAAYQARCLVEMDLGKEARALSSLRKAIEAAPRRADTRVWAASLFKKMGRYREAAAQLQAALRFDPGHLPAYAELGQLSLWRGDAAQALALSQKMLRIDPKFWAAFRIRGAAYVLSGRYPRAIKELDAAISLFSKGAWFRRKLTKHRYITRAGNNYLRPEDPGDCESHIWRGEAKRRLGRYAQAKADVDKALALSAQSVGGLVNKALLEIALSGAPAENLFRLIKIHFPKPINPTLGELLPSAQSLEKMLELMSGNRTLALSFLTKPGSRAWPKQHIDYFHSDDQLELQERIRFGDVGAVFKEFNRRMREKPGDAYMLSARGETFIWIGRYAEGIRDLKRSLKMNPSLAWPEVGICGAYAVTGKYREALALLDVADKKAVPIQLMARWRGEIYRRMGEFDKAFEALSQSMELFPYKPSYWLNLALTKGALGDKEGCTTIFRDLCRAIPEFMSAAAGEAGIPLRPGLSGSEIEALLEKALSLMKGNRSSWMYTYVLGSGRVKHIKIKPLEASRVPRVFVNHSAAFLRYFVLNKNS